MFATTTTIKYWRQSENQCWALHTIHRFTNHEKDNPVQNSRRRYSLRIWYLGLGFYLFYTPYSALTKSLANGFLTATPIRGTVLLPISAIATVVGMLGFLTLAGWWKYAGRRNVLGINIPFPRRLTFLSGVCMATIMGTTTLAFTFGGLSIVLVLVLLRGGTLIIAPIVDAIVGRRVRWFSWAAMFTSLLAVTVVLADAANYTLAIAAVIDIAAYLIAYFFKLQFMSRLAKTDQESATRRYFVEEQMVAAPLLALSLIVMAVVGSGDLMLSFRVGLTTFVNTPAAVYAALVGLCYAGLCICTTLIFLDRRENTFCMPMHCGSSMLSGFTATAILAFLFNLTPASPAQTLSAGFIVIALGFLSPLHHFNRVLAKLGLGPIGKFATPATAGTERLFLFVCSGNTCRSPMAAALANAEIAARLRIPYEALETVNVRALSAGITARLGAPLAPEAQEVLRSLSVPVRPHAARNLTPELAQKAEMIFCMTSAQRTAVIGLIPSVAYKTYCLDEQADVEDPMGKGMQTYLDCARRIRSLVQLRFDELPLKIGFSEAGN
jgi:protein-tyrosine-phosphatase